jgi:acetate kinase
MEMDSQKNILAVNVGSSSVKFALFGAADPAEKILAGSVETASATDDILRQIHDHIQGGIAAVGHRVVSGGPKYPSAAIIDDAMLGALHARESFDPDHLPGEIRLIEEFRARLPGVPQVACFDTTFFADLPRIAQIVAIPRRYGAQGVRRYGFHGLSYAYLLKEIARTQGDAAARGRVVMAHLGSGVSLAAVRGGKPVDTTMSFTPASGIPMSTRSGDLDPGLAWYLAASEGMDAKHFNEMVNHESGLLGISETSADMYYLLEHEATDVRCVEAVTLFCYEVKKRIGAFAAAMGGIDMLVFSGGMGEEAPRIRRRVCEGLGFLGIELEAGKNEAGEGVISKTGNQVSVLVIKSDEAAMIAEEVRRVLPTP